MRDIAEIEVEEEQDLGYEELDPIMVDKRFFVGETFDLLTQGNFILNNLSEASRKDADGNEVIDLGYAHWVVALLCGSLSGVLERLNNNLTESEQKRLQLGDALAGLSQHLTTINRVEEKIDMIDNGIGFIAIERAATSLNLSVERLRHLCYENKIAFIRQGKTIYFRPEWLKEYLQSGEYHKKLI